MIYGIRVTAFDFSIGYDYGFINRLMCCFKMW